MGVVFGSIKLTKCEAGLGLLWRTLTSVFVVSSSSLKLAAEVRPSPKNEKNKTKTPTRITATQFCVISRATPRKNTERKMEISICINENLSL
jgi:hypothetical protein